MTPLEAACLHGLGLGLLYAATLASARSLLRRDSPAGMVRPMTVIRPLKGLDEGLEDNLRSLVDADPDGALELLFAIESESDPAYPVAKRVADSAPGGRARVLVTGPSGERMGKAHNMIEALRHATKDVVVFSDSDARVDRAVLVETSRAFDQGADAVAGLPDASRAKGLGDVLVCLCFNHYFDGIGILASRLGLATLFSGTWMGLRRELLERVGGLEQFARHAADDFALADAARRAGARAVVLPRLVELNERGGSLGEAALHVLKWTRIVRATAPWSYLALPLATPLPLAAAAIFAWPESASPALGLAALSAMRIGCAWAFDARGAGARFPLWGYLSLPLLDLAFIGLWVAGLLGDTIEWRGRRYRVLKGGLLDSVPA